MCIKPPKKDWEQHIPLPWIEKKHSKKTVKNITALSTVLNKFRSFISSLMWFLKRNTEVWILHKPSTQQNWKKKCSFPLKKIFSVYKSFAAHSNRELLEEVLRLVWAELWGRTLWMKFGRWLWTPQDHPKRCHRTISAFCHKNKELLFQRLKQLY